MSECLPILYRLSNAGEVQSPTGGAGSLTELAKLPRGLTASKWLDGCRETGRAACRAAGGGWLLAIPEDGHFLAAIIKTVADTEIDAWAGFARILGSRSGPLHVAQRLRDCEMRLSFALQSLKAGIFDWNLVDGRVTYLPWQEATLYPKSFETHASSWDEQVHPDDRDAGREQVAAALSGKADTFRMVVRQRTRAHADYRVVESSGRIVEYSSEGSPTRVVGTFVDVTERVEFERRLRDSESTLARAAEYAMLGELASGVAHELNQPLAALLAYLSIANKQSKSLKTSSLKKTLRETSRMAERLADTVARVRRLVRRATPSPDPYDLVAASQAAVESTRRSLSDTTLLFRIEASAAPELRKLTGDALQIDQLISNLLRNAADACRSGGGRRIVIRLSCVKNKAQVAVTDDGPGIPPDVAARIFDPFFTTKPGGMGLGLTLCRSIAEAHGGELHLSDPRQGHCTFTLTLPLHLSED